MHQILYQKIFVTLRTQVTIIIFLSKEIILDLDYTSLPFELFKNIIYHKYLAVTEEFELYVFVYCMFRIDQYLNIDTNVSVLILKNHKIH
jgi:hypothetical protein